MSDREPNWGGIGDVEWAHLGTSQVSGRFVITAPRDDDGHLLDEQKGKTVFGAARDAVLLLEHGREVDWCPGDSTRYRLLLVKGPEDVYLLVTNMSAMIRIYRREQHFSAADYVREGGPRGGWAGLRPIITALGYRPMEPLVYDPKDADQETFFRKQEERR